MKTVRARVIRWGHEGAIEESDELASEEPLEILIGETPVAVTMRTPGNDIELAAGFLLTEGLIDAASVPLLKQNHPNRVTLGMPNVNASKLRGMQRQGTISASCGVCGKRSIESVLQHFAPIEEEFVMAHEAFAAMAEALERAQPGFESTGGVHAAAIFDDAGRTVVVREDIGRHNAVDKAIGFAHLKKLLPLHRHSLLVSGRASFEIVQKALGAGIPVIAAVSAPSSLAAQFADESGQTLVGFLRKGRFNVYTHGQRIA
jgi:FdhD protein